MGQKKNSYVVNETVFRETSTDHYRYYRDNSKEAIEKLIFLYNDWREEVNYRHPKGWQLLVFAS